MVSDDYLYVLLLLLSIAAGPVIRKYGEPSNRQHLSSAIGFVLVFVASGWNLAHSLFTTLVNAVLLSLCPEKYCHIASFIYNFMYLAFFRLTYYFGLPIPTSQSNAVQMILTLKMIGLAFEVHNLWKLKQDASKQNSVELQHCSFNLSFTDVFHYAFCHAGMLIGPYYKYRTYTDMLRAPYMDCIPMVEMLKQRICVVPAYAILFLISDFCFPLKMVTSGEILQTSLWYRIFYYSPLFFTFRMRIYVGFVLGECVCIAAGLGLYPSVAKPAPGEGPTDFKALQEFTEHKEKWEKADYDYETVHNIEEFKSEFKPTIREGIRSWNKTVQFWLATFVYKKMPFSKPVRMCLVMLTSAYWHGVHPGYYLCLLSAPFFLMAEAQMEATFKKGAPPQRQLLFDAICWFLKMQSFSYMGVAFLLLRIDTTLAYWRSIYFVGHIAVAGIFCLGYYCRTRRPKGD